MSAQYVCIAAMDLSYNESHRANNAAQLSSYHCFAAWHCVSVCLLSVSALKWARMDELGREGQDRVDYQAVEGRTAAYGSEARTRRPAIGK